MEERKSEDKLNNVSGIDRARPGCDLKWAEEEESAAKMLIKIKI